MQSIIQEIQADLLRFIRNPRERMLIIVSEPEASALLLKSLDAAEEAPDSPEIFLTFGHEFLDLEEFVLPIPLAISQQIDLVNQELSRRGESLIDPLTDEVVGATLLPGGRLLELMRQVEMMVPVDRQVIWLFFPMRIGNELGWLKLNQFLWERLDGELLRRTKLIVRDSEKAPMLAPEFEGQTKVKIWRPELDAQSFERRIAEKAGDPRIPLEER